MIQYLVLTVSNLETGNVTYLTNLRFMGFVTQGLRIMRFYGTGYQRSVTITDDRRKPKLAW